MAAASLMTSSVVCLAETKKKRQQLQLRVVVVLLLMLLQSIRQSRIVQSVRLSILLMFQLPPRRPAGFSGPAGGAMSASPTFADPGARENMIRGNYGMGQSGNQPIYDFNTERGMPPHEGVASDFIKRSGVGVAPTPRASTDFLTNQLYRKKGGRVGREDGGQTGGLAPNSSMSTASNVSDRGTSKNYEKGGAVKYKGDQQDFEARSNESQGSQGLRPRQGHDAGGSVAETAFRKGGKVKRAAGGKMSSSDFEGTAKDEKQDKKLAKKHHMSFDQWEKSDMDKKHDRQQSMEGLRKGGRAERSRGGKTTVNIMLDRDGGQQQMPPPNPMLAAMLAKSIGNPGMGAGPAFPPPPPRSCWWPRRCFTNCCSSSCRNACGCSWWRNTSWWCNASDATEGWW
jgi:hypothetical protein